MLIPNKFSGFHNGVRRCFGPGGGGGGGTGGDPASIGEPTGGDPASIGDPGVGPGAPGGDGTNYVYTPPAVNINASNPGANTNFSNVGTSSIYSGPGVSTPQGMATLGSAKGQAWGQSGGQYNDLLNQGFTSNQIRNSASTMYGAPSDANWGAMVQNAGMNSPTGRPMAGSDQFFQPVYNQSYMNYARPATQFDVSMYGTQPVQSPAFASGMSRGNINSAISGYFGNNPNSDINSTLSAMRESGINRSDVQQWGGVNNYGPQMPTFQTQQPFNPYTNSSSYGGQSNFMPQMQNPFMQPQQNMSQYMPQQSMSQYMPQQQYSQPAMSYQPMSNPFASQASSYNYQQPQYNPYQMQSPFSYQQPSYGGYSSYGGDFGGGVNMYTPVTQQPTQPVAPRSSGPTTPIVGRSSGFRGTPNVMRRAEGGIIDLMDKK